MTKALMSAADLYSQVREVPGAFAAFGPGADVDAAFDEAVSAAGYDYGFAELLPSVTAADPSAVSPVDGEALSVDQAVARMRAHIAQAAAARAAHASEDDETATEPAPQPVLAWPVAASAAHSRRRVRVVLDGTDLDMPVSAGVLLDPPAELAAALAEAGVAPGEGEVLERVEVKVRARFKPVPTPIKDKTEGRFVVVDPATQTIVSDGHAKSSEARRAAVALLKAKPATDLSTGHLEVFKLSGRLGGLPLIRVQRTKVAQRVTVKATFATVKKPGATKVAGWLFAGLLP